LREISEIDGINDTAILINTSGPEIKFGENKNGYEFTTLSEEFYKTDVMDITGLEVNKYFFLFFFNKSKNRFGLMKMK